MNNERRGTRYLALDKTYFELYGWCLCWYSNI